MNPAFVPRLINGPFGDPGLHIQLRWEGRAVLFDLGQNDTFPAGDLCRVSHVCVSHCHMDHFIGFDRLLRVFLGRNQTLCLYGPPGILDCVEGKLRGYTWNLVDGYGFSLEVAEVWPDSIRRAVFQAASGFRRESLPTQPFRGLVVDEPAFCIRATHLDHRIYSMAFALEEKSHLNVDSAYLARLGVPPGPWLSALKGALRRGEPDSWLVTATWQENGLDRSRKFSLGEVRGSLIKETQGQKFAYVVDTLFSPENTERIAALAQGADIFFCESPFLDADEDQATKRYHLTAKQAGLLGRSAQVRELRVFHFSPRYAGRAEELYREAQASFGGESPPAAPPAERNEAGALIPAGK